MMPDTITASPPAPPRSARTPGSLYWPVRVTTSPFRRLWFDVDHQGLENVPAFGPVVLAANHLSFLDSVLLMYSLPRKVMFLGKAEYTQSLKTRFFPAAGMIPVDRGGKGLVRSMRQAMDVLHSEGVVGIFPEGTRVGDGSVHRGHSGAAHLALRTGAALVPVGVSGTDLVQPRGAAVPKRGPKVTLRFGPPMDVAGAGSGSTARHQVTGQLMRNIAVLARRPYNDELVASGS